VAGIEGNSLAWRLGYWGTVIDLANDSPIVGIGPKMTQYVTDSARVPHNDYLRAYVETGVLGLTAYVALVTALIHTARNALRWAPPGFGQGVAVGFAGCVASFLLFSVGENLMSQVVVLWYFVAFAAAAVTASRWHPGSENARTGVANPRNSSLIPLRLPDDRRE
jgi:putative inorganic carbon (hco3(-)) transporter